MPNFKHLNSLLDTKAGQKHWICIFLMYLFIPNMLNGLEQMQRAVQKEIYLILYVQSSDKLKVTFLVLLLFHSSAIKTQFLFALKKEVFHKQE